MKDLYYILGTDNKATPAELNAAYSKLAEKLQPQGWEQDNFLGEHFREITEAYELLSDPKRRRMYDVALKNSQQRRLDRFKLSYLNVAATLTLIAFTSLFGYYVLKAINGKNAVTVVKAPAVAAIAIAPKHHKKKHAVAAVVKAAPERENRSAPKHVWVKVDTAVSKPVKASAVVSQPIKTSPSIVAPPIVTKQAPAPVISTPIKSTPEYMASIQSNVTGLVYLHKEANYTSTVVSKIPNHAQVKVLERGQSFCKISFNDETGYVPTWSIPAQ